MKALITTFAIFALFTFLPACNDHLSGDDGDGEGNNVSSAVIVETLSSAKTALWVELGTGDYDFALTKARTAADPDLVGHRVSLPNGLSAMVVTGEDELIIEADLFEVWEVPADKVGAFEMLIRNLWMMPSGWQPNLFPTTEGEAADLEILLSAFICGQELDLYSRGCQSDVPSNLFRFVGETSYYEWKNQGHAKYVFVVKN